LRTKQALLFAFFGSTLHPAAKVWPGGVAAPGDDKNRAYLAAMAKKRWKLKPPLSTRTIRGIRDAQCRLGAESALRGLA
jgi:hypothetical protein